MWYFNEQIIIMEFGKEHENDQEQYFKLRNINFSVMGTIDGNIKMPFRGFNKDPSYDELVFYFVNQQADGYRQCSRGFDFSLTSAIYINDEGKVCEPYGSIIFRTAFCKNAWSSGSYDCGGFIFIQYRDDDFFGMTIPQFAMAYTTQNSMIDRDNATWGSDYFHNIMHAIKSFQEITIRERKGFDRNTYTIKDKGNGVDAHLYFDFLNDGGLSAYDNLEYDISYSLSNWVVGYYDKTRDDFYYDPEYTNPIPKNVNYSYLVFIGRYQQTPTTWIWVYDLYYWDVVGFLLQKGDAYAFTHQEEELPSGIHHSITLKRTLRRELTYTDFRSRRLLKDSEYYHEDNGYFTKIGDTEFEGGYSGYWTYAFAARVSSTNIAPLILSDEEEPASYINRTYYKTKLIKYFDKWWYYTDLSRSVSVNTNQAYGRFVNELITNIHMVPIHCLIKVYGSEYRQYKEDSEYFVENAGLYTTAKQGNYERKCYKENPGKSYCIGAIYKNGSYNFLYTIILSDLHSPAVIKLDNPEWTSSSWGIVKHNNRYWYYTIANVMSWLYNAAFTERSMNIQAVINNRYHTDDDIALYCLDKIYKNEDSNEVLEL